MPLVTFINPPTEIHFDDLSGTILDTFNIPDPYDKEWRLEKNPNRERSVNISFTTGPNEYPDFSNPAFEPSKELIHRAGVNFLKRAKELGLGITEVALEAWKPDATTFRFRPFPEERTGGELTDGLISELAKNIECFQVTIIVPDRVFINEGGHPQKESENGNETPFSSFGSEIRKKIIENFGLTENTENKIEIKQVPDALTDLSIEVDFKSKNDIGKETRQNLADRLQDLVDQRYPVEKVESASIWIRQGEPEVTKVNINEIK